MNLEKAFDRVQRKLLEWAMRKKGIVDVLFGSVMSMYEGANERVRVDSELSDKVDVKVGMYQGSLLLPFIFAVVVGGSHSLGKRVC